MKTIKKLLFLLLFATQIITANNLNISNITKTSDNQLSFDVSWDNSWWVSTYRDASWIFVKYKNSSGQWNHLDLTSATVSGFTLFTFPDNKGVMLSRAFSGTGTVTGTVTVNFNGGVLGPLPDFKVFGIEMVYINEGPFYVGDGEGNTNRFHQGDNVNLPYYVQDSNEITVGNTSSDLAFSGLSTNIPATYPTGFDAFYLMKYEITNEQYVTFLNTLTPLQQQNRTKTDLSLITNANHFVLSSTPIPNYRNAVACDPNAVNTSVINFYCDLNDNQTANEINDGQNIACSLLPFESNLAYLDWAAMRPMTDMEYEKAARGTAVPIINDIANGSTLFVSIGNITNSGSVNESVDNIGVDGLVNQGGFKPIRVGAFATNSSNRIQSGGSYYGVMDLAGNISEHTVASYTFTNPSPNLNFNYSFGDGLLDTNGMSNNWNFLTTFQMKGGSVALLSSFLRISNSSFQFDFQNTSISNASGTARGCR